MMPGSRPGLLAIRLALLVGLSVGCRLLSVRLLRMLRLTLPLVGLLLAVRIPWRLLTHDALPCTAPVPCLPTSRTHQIHSKCAESANLT